MVACMKPRQEALLEQLLSGKNIVAASRAAGVPERTALRWMQPHNAFAEEYEQRRQAQRDRFQANINELHDLAFKALRDTLKGKNIMLRFAAAKLIWRTHLMQHGG